MRSIVQSRTYKLSAAPNETNREDRINYSRSQPRLLEAAVLLDAISAATGVPEKFDYHAMTGGGAPAPGARAMQMLPDLCTSQFMDAYGRSMRKTPGPGAPQPNLSQALHMLAGSTYTSKLAKEGGRISQLIQRGAGGDEVLEELYLASLSRLPTDRQRAALLPALYPVPAA